MKEEGPKRKGRRKRRRNGQKEKLKKKKEAFDCCVGCRKTICLSKQEKEAL